MTVKELYEKLEERIPRSLSCSWDNDGLMCCADENKEVHRVLVALDITAEIVEKAIAGGYDAVVSHHPFVFRPLKAVEPSFPVAKKVIRMLVAGVSAISFHTRLDAVCGGVNDTLADALGLTEVIPFGNDGETIGRIGYLKTECSLEDFAKQVKAVTDAPCVTVADGGVPVKRVAILGGSGSDDVMAAKSAGADTYLSGELAHHYLTDCPELEINLIAAGHFYTENPICEKLRQVLLEIDSHLTVDLANSNRIRII